MHCLSTDWEFDGTLVEAGVENLTRIRDFGLLDLGLTTSTDGKISCMSFDNDEREHGSKYLSEGFSVICHPWPTMHPSLGHGGSQRRPQGREITPVKPFFSSRYRPSKSKG